MAECFQGGYTPCLGEWPATRVTRESVRKPRQVLNGEPRSEIT